MIIGPFWAPAPNPAISPGASLTQVVIPEREKYCTTAAGAMLQHGAAKIPLLPLAAQKKKGEARKANRPFLQNYEDAKFRKIRQ